MAHEPAVTVIVPVFSTGPYIRPLLDCLDRQLPPDGGFEALFVDDGSTDATAALLERWAQDRPWSRVIRLPRSGWPSRPRNVGIAQARGEFVFFVDHDDWLADDALARMTAFAREHGSDVVLGSMRGLGRHVPVRLFSRTVGDARPPRTPLQDSMTVHVMFRTAFLRDTGIRFDESLRRLEDHVFMAAAYTSARRISVLAGAPVYLHAARADSANAAHLPYAAADYYAALGRAVDIVLASHLPDDERFAYLHRWMRTELLDRLRSDAVRALPDPERDSFFTEVQALLRRMPDAAVDSLPAAYRERAERLRRGTAGEQEARDVADLPTPMDSARSRADSARSRAVSAGRRVRAAIIDVLSRTGPGVRRRMIAWGRSLTTMLRDLGAGLAVASAVAGAGIVLVAPFAAIVLTAVSTALAAWLAPHSLRAWPTAVRQLLALSPGVVAAVAHRDVAAGVGVAVTAALVGIGVVADRAWRRSDVRGYPARRGPFIARLGWIGVTASVLAVAITATVAVSALR